LSDVTVDDEVLASHVFVPPTPVPPDPDPLLPECGVKSTHYAFVQPARLVRDMPLP